MLVNAGELNKRIQIFDVSFSTHSEGYREYQEAPVYSCWAKPSRNSGTTLVKANAGFDQETIRFLIRYTRKEIKRNLFVRFGGNIYAIQYVNDYNGREYMELWCKRIMMDSPQIVTLYNLRNDADAPNLTVLRNVFVDRSRGAGLSMTGMTNEDTVKLYIPAIAMAENPITGDTQHYISPKLYLEKTDKSRFWTIDPKAGNGSCFFAMGHLSEVGKYQDINAKHDDVFRIGTATLRNFGSPMALYLEVDGR